MTRIYPLLAACVAAAALTAASAEAQSPVPGVQGSTANPQRSEGPRKASDLALVGLIVREGGAPIAVIEDRRSKKQGLYKVGALVGGGRLARILEDRIVLVFTDGEVELRLAGTPSGVSPAPPAGPATVIVEASPPSPPPDSTESGSYRMPGIERAALETLIRSPDLIMQVTPHEERGVRVGEVRTATLFDLMGLRKGDVIRSVNGLAPGSTVPLPRAIEQAIPAGLLRLEVERKGKVDIKYLQIRP